MFKHIGSLFAAGILLVAAGGSVKAGTVIDFEDIISQNFGSPIVSDNFSFSFSGGWFIGPGPFASFNDDGSSRLLAISNTTVNITSVDSQPFSIQQFLGATGLTGGNGTITLTGQLAGGGTVTTNINLTPTYTTIAVDPSFTNLSSLTIVDDGQGFSLDNIAVNGASATPEPGTFLLLGVAAIPALLLKRKKSATRSC